MPKAVLESGFTFTAALQVCCWRAAFLKGMFHLSGMFLWNPGGIWEPLVLNNLAEPRADASGENKRQNRVRVQGND